MEKIIYTLNSDLYLVELDFLCIDQHAQYWCWSKYISENVPACLKVRFPLPTVSFQYESSEQDCKHLITYQPVDKGERSQEGAV